jgi:hypothetical protein
MSAFVKIDISTATLDALDFQRGNARDSTRPSLENDLACLGENR